MLCKMHESLFPESTNFLGQKQTLLDETKDCLHQSSKTTSTRRPLPPRRPSRDGTVDLELKPFPVVQSNLSSLSIHGRRRSGSQQGRLTKTPPASLPRPVRDQTASQEERSQGSLPPRNRTPANDEFTQADAIASASLLSRNRPAPPTRLSHSKTSSKDSNSSASTGLGKLSTFFSRRARTVPGADAPDKKLTRRGPAAGTGHEGYGKYAQHGRKSSSSSIRNILVQANSTPRQATNRQDNRGSRTDSDLEAFVAQRLDPVVILGGGGYRHRPESDAPTVWPTFDQSPLQSPSLHTPVFQDATRDAALSVSYLNSDSEASAPASASKDGFEPLQPRHSVENPDRFIETSMIQDLPTIEPYLSLQTPPNTEISTGINFQQNAIRDDDKLLTIPVEVKNTATQNEMHRVDINSLRKTGKKGRNLRWNFFHKASGRENDVRKPANVQSSQLPVTVARLSPHRNVPYYAVIDSESGNDTQENLDDVLSEAMGEKGNTASNENVQTIMRSLHGNSILLPSFPTLPDEYQNLSPFRINLQSDDSPTLISKGNNPNYIQRAARLPRVGRIPRVISRGDHEHRPPVQSFSRPFSHDERPRDSLPAFPVEPERPILGIQTDILPSRPFGDFDSAKPASAPARAIVSPATRSNSQQPEFLTYQSRHDSEVSISASSEGVLSIAGPARLPSGLLFHHAEDEWKEYDDLLDHVLSPTTPKTGKSTTSSQGDPFRYANLASQDIQALLREHVRDDLRQEDIEVRYVPPSSLVVPKLSAEPSTEEIRLRRSRIAPALHASFAPSSPFSVGDYATDRSSVVQALSSASTAEDAYLSPLTYVPPEKVVHAKERSHYHSTVLLDVAERDQAGPVAQSDLRFAALMTSKWLSFGRVLFSPAHEEMQRRPEQHILVIDGLGNDDWSFYCALTYPTALIHDLKETEIGTKIRQENFSDSWEAPPNYRSVNHPDLAERFPYPQGYFTAVILRFPPAMSEGIMKMILAECRRVLMPGGHLEFTVLDLDLVNMGNYTRRAVRNLKVRMNVADPDVSLKSTSDNIQDLLGRKGFENLNRCVVGVPVAGNTIGSVDSTSSRSSNSSHQRRGSSGLSGPPGTPSNAQSGNFSLSELVADNSPTSDEKITKMVSKVGRWWYTRCYEWAVLPGGNLGQSIWADRKVLRECRRRGSGFKMVIAYAQKPGELRRRTLSEPAMPAMAISGTREMNRMDEAAKSFKSR